MIMPKGWRNLVLTLLLAAVAGGLGAWAGARFATERAGTPHSLHDAVHDLDLTPDQERRIEAAETRFAARRKALEAQMREANVALAEAMRTSRANTPEVQAAVDRCHQVMGELQKATIAHVFEMRAVLNPDQARRFDAEVVSALTRHHR